MVWKRWVFLGGVGGSYFVSPPLQDGGPGGKAVMSTYLGRFLCRVLGPQAHRPTRPSISGASPSPSYQSGGRLSILTTTPSSTAFANADPMRHRFPFSLKVSQDRRATAYNITDVSIYSKTCQLVKFFHLGKEAPRASFRMSAVPGRRARCAKLKP